MSDKPVNDFLPGWYRQAAEAATEVGHKDDDARLPEGAAISFLAAVALVAVAAGLVVLFTIYA